MEELIRNFPLQLEDAIKIASSTFFNKNSFLPKNVVISGLGGSGIGGRIIKQLSFNQLKCPVEVNNTYVLPAYVNEKTLVICSSYSGNTEETLSAFKEAIKKNATIVIISSGGELLKNAKKHNLDYIQLPGGFPPRTCLGYSLISLIYILSSYGIISTKLKEEILSIPQFLKELQDTIIEESKKIANFLFKNIPVIYSSSFFEAVAIRFRQQLNENAKTLAWHHIIPEMNHNELVGWRGKYNNIAVLILRSKNEFYRNSKRIEIIKPIIKKSTSNLMEIWSKGKNHCKETFYFIHLLDWVSLFLAKKYEVDPVEVKVIEHLKKELSRID